MKACKETKPDIIILDVMLPDIDGYEVCKQIRAFSLCPILFLSSKNDELDKILGLAVGGDDYVTKPFSPKEIAYRVKAQLRRLEYKQNACKRDCVKIGELTIDPEGCGVMKGSASHRLCSTYHQYACLYSSFRGPGSGTGCSDIAGAEEGLFVSLRFFPVSL